ncbi:MULTISPECIES: hypothetical protein [Paenibacillus]|uniref:hypothetical protein n=1 Tax=Paenibacillus TaxID=44249 RepID=UPI0022B8FFD3|nr:hypothetical protein [Paenibacillus caseinilyticus]MCZ8520659.1 hypothetical protein [Paenibacillus caseinilyticus]
MGKILKNALLFSVGLHVLYFGYKIGYGMYLTLTYVPEIVEASAASSALPEQVSFGSVPAFGGLDYLWSFLGWMGLYLLLIHPLLRKRTSR